jgi:hypothetical protein
MNDSMFGVGALMGSLGRLLRHFLFAPSAARSTVPVLQAARKPVTPLRPATRPTGKAVAQAHGPTPARDRTSRSPLRIIRVIESGQAPTLTGRMIMSGRMADVCAELDRMVEREATMQPGA